MNSENKREIEERIFQEIRRAKEDIERLSKSREPVSPDNAIGRLSRIEAMSAREVSESALRQARNRLSGLKSALANLQEPEFGSCLECGEQIPLARILLLPHSKLCVPCAEEAE